MHYKKILITLAISLVIIGAVTLGLRQLNSRSSVPNLSLERLALCLKEKGAVFYGAFWCGHCQSTKAAFGASAKYLPYVECSADNGKDQLTICRDQNITAYPTWVFPDGSRQTGELSPEVLAAKSDCQLQ